MAHNMTYKFKDYLGIKNNNPFTILEAKATEAKTTKEVSEKEIASYDYKDKSNPDNQIFDQYIKGLKFEMEQNLELLEASPKESLLKAKDIVIKNLKKDPLYYMKNAAFGVKDLGYVDQKPQGEPTGKHKSSGYGDIKENKMKKSEQLKELLEEAVAGIPSIGNPFAERKSTSYENKFAAFLAEEKEKATKEGKKEKDLPPPPPEAGGPGGFALEEENPKEEKEPKKEGKAMKFEEVVKMTEKAGEMAKNRVMMEMYGRKMNELKETLNTINEDSNLAEFIDDRKTAALQKEIALYEKYHLNAEANYNNNK
tara:strand:+ start:1429 stop:2361 length:933 start_codon:yes stop_codon:yes gene_type:complete